MITEPHPENIPLRRTISRGSFSDSRRVQLFSMPQHRQASRINTEPSENLRLDRSSNESSAQEDATNPMPSHKRGLICSRKITSAISAVATISKLLSRDAFAAVVRERPNRRKIGARISSTIMASVYGRSARRIRSSVRGSRRNFLNSATPPIPSPAPIYRTPAISVDGISASSSLENGALIA